MPKRVSPIETIRADIHEVFGSGRPIEECLEGLMRHSVRLVLQQVLEDEVTTWLGRSWNSRLEPARQGQRNGHSDLTVKTTAGRIELKRPKPRNTSERFASALFGKGVVRSAPLEAPGPRPRGGAVEVDRIEDLPEAQGRLRSVPEPGPVRHRSGLPVLGRVPFQDV